MILNVDVGNTRIKWRQDSDDPVQAVKRAEELVLWQQWRQLQGVTRVRVASVASEQWCAQFEQQCLRHLGLKPEFARVVPGQNGLNTVYQAPETLGVDRWLALMGARHQWPGRACLVMSSGTALTLDLLTGAGEHLGGYIAPGLGLASQALFARTDRVPPGDLDLSIDAQPGGTTLECVRSGFSALYGGLLQQVWGQAQKQLEDPVLVYCGGDAGRLQPLLPVEATLYCQPDLVLQGLVLALP